jgi:hypothetical protein
MRDNKEALTDLASHCCNLINSVLQKSHQGRELPQEMASNLQEFVGCVS